MGRHFLQLAPSILGPHLHLHPWEAAAQRHSGHLEERPVLPRSTLSTTTLTQSSCLQAHWFLSSPFQGPPVCHPHLCASLSGKTSIPLTRQWRVSHPAPSLSPVFPGTGVTQGRGGEGRVPSASPLSEPFPFFQIIFEHWRWSCPAAGSNTHVQQLSFENGALHPAFLPQLFTK